MLGTMRARVLLFLVFLAVYMALIISCNGENIFASSSKEVTDSYIDGSTDELLYGLYRDDVVSELSSNERKRNTLISKLEDKIDSSSGEEKLKNQMAYSSVVSKTTELNQIINLGSIHTIVELAQGDITLNENPRELVDALFKDAHSGDVKTILRNSLTVSDTLNSLGEGIGDNDDKFPKGFEAIAGDYAEQALMTGLVSTLVDSVVVANPAGTEPTDSEKINAVADYINNRESTVTFIAASNLASNVIGTPSNPTGYRTLLNAGGFEAIVDKIDDEART